MKIAFIVSGFPRLSETFILNQVTGLLDNGHDVRIFAGYDPRESKEHADVERYRLADRVHYPAALPRNKTVCRLKALGAVAAVFLQRPIATLRMLRNLLRGDEGFCYKRLYTALAFLKKRFDIIHCHFGHNGELAVFLKEADMGVKLAVMFHGSDIRLGLKEGPQRYRPLFAAADSVLANSQYSYRHLIDFGSDPKKTAVHPVGIDLKRFSCRDLSAVRPPSDKIALITVGRLVEEKGPEYGIKAFARLAEANSRCDLTYRIVGDGPLEDELKALARELSLEEKIIFTGSASGKEVIEHLQQADIFLLPSVAEAFGLVLIEAQAMGMPVVATSVDGVAEALRPDESGFLVPGKDVDIMAEKLQYLIDHPECWPEMGRCGREFAEKNFDIKSLNQRLLRIFGDLLEGRVEPGA